MNSRASVWLPLLMFVTSLQGCRELSISHSPVETSEEARVSAATGTATIDWAASTENDDGSVLTDLAGYRLRYGTSPGVYTSVLEVGNVNRYTVRDLAPGRTYYFAVSAVNSSADESPVSNEVSKRIE